MNIPLKTKKPLKIKMSLDVFEIMQRILMRESKTDRNREHFWTICLNNANLILNIELVSIGSVNKTVVEPMEIFSIPLQKRAVKIILIHNHPSGELKPSEQDKDLTDRLIQGGEILNISVEDHIIITESNYYSFFDDGLMGKLRRSKKYVLAFTGKSQLERYEKQVKEEINKKAIEIAQELKSKGVSIEIIESATGLTKAAIRKINT